MKTKIRKPSDVQKIRQEKEKEKIERIEKSEEWFKFWEKGSEVNYKKLKKGGFKRPKTFSFEPEEYIDYEKIQEEEKKKFRSRE